MKKGQRIFALVLSIFLFQAAVKAQTDTIPKDFCISADEYQLYQLVNDYRKAFALPPIALSKSLSFVANLHARDLAANYKTDTLCNMHSWSDKGRWKPICFPKEQSKKNNVWLKAKEISGYPSEAYELTYWSNVKSTAREILSFWRENKAASDRLLNRDDWEKKNWKAMGVAIQNGYAVLWLGDAIDYEVSTPVCGSSIKVINNASPEYKATHAQKNNQNPVYYITIGSYNKREDAVNAVKSYKEMGYPRTVLVETEHKVRVAIDYFTDKEKADAALKKYGQKFKGAWILRL